jgi:hypothetical protein
MLRQRSDISSAIVTEAINEAYKRIVVGKFIDAQRNLRKLKFPELEKRADSTLVTGAEAYSLPTYGYAVFMVRHRFSTTPTEQWFRLRRKTPQQLWQMQDTSGRPAFFTFYQNSIWVRNIPSSDYNGQTLRMWYYEIPQSMTGSGDSPVINSIWHPLIAIEASRDLAQRYGYLELAATYAGDFAQQLATLRLPTEIQGADGESGGLLQ